MEKMIIAPINVTCKLGILNEIIIINYVIQ